MKVLHIAAELAPIAKVGGMADVLLGLTREQTRQISEVSVLLPKYGCIDFSSVQDLELIDPSLETFFKEKILSNSVWQGRVEGILVYFIEPHPPIDYFENHSIYTGHNEMLRFLYFCGAATAFVKKHAKDLDILHLHDWHTAAIAALCRPQELPFLKKVLTLHNLAYEGKCDETDLKAVGLDSSVFADPSQPQGANLLKGGIERADAITTVSPTYAKEILKSGPLALTLKKHVNKLSGILNGIDYTTWNPATDSHLLQHFSNRDPLNETPPFLSGKQKNQAHLRDILSLAPNSLPLVGTICRLVEQKSPDLIIAALHHTLQLGGQFVLLGSAADKEIHQQFLALKKDLSYNKNVHIELTFNESLSHLVYAASDLFIVPSRFEPCGLTQLIAMRYGGVPLVRETGGLADTVFDTQNGFTFAPLSKEALTQTLSRAFTTWRTPHWRTLLKNGMTQDHSWEQGAKQYLKLYRQLLLYS